MLMEWGTRFADEIKALVCMVLELIKTVLLTMNSRLWKLLWKAAGFTRSQASLSSIITLLKLRDSTAEWQRGFSTWSGHELEASGEKQTVSGANVRS